MKQNLVYSLRSIVNNITEHPRVKSVILLIQILSFITFLSGILSQIDFLKDFSIVYTIFLSFTLPFLIAKVFLKRFFSIFTITFFLLYFLIYLCSLTLKTLISPDNFYLIASILIILSWNLLSIHIITRSSKQEIKYISKKILFVFFAIVPFLISFALLRNYDSVMSTDLLVHKTVLNGMEKFDNYSFMPSGYSNMFTDEGYPVVFFHPILFFIDNSLNFDFQKIAYLIDPVFTIFLAFIIFKVFKRATNNNFDSTIGTLLTILVFENTAYTYHYFIPQTLCFLFFIIALLEVKLTLKKLMLSALLLILCHFFIGTFLSVLLIFKYLYFDVYFKNENAGKLNFVKEGYVLLIFVMLISAAGFSFESTFQSQTLVDIGVESNPSFTGKLQLIFNLFGFASIILFPALILISLKKIKNNIEHFSIYYLQASLIAYFIGPTFAAKFFLGFGLFSIILLIKYLEKVNYRNIFTFILIIVGIISSFIFNFVKEYRALYPFLTQTDGYVSAVTIKDAEILKFWRNEKPECIIISDPATQLSLHSLGGGNSARGHYMTLESRKILRNFIINPSESTLNTLLNINEVEGDQGICLIISQRLIDLIDENYPWTEVIYNYKVDHSRPIQVVEAVNFLRLNNTEIYSDSYFVVFKF